MLKRERKAGTDIVKEVRPVLPHFDHNQTYLQLTMSSTAYYVRPSIYMSICQILQLAR